MTIYFLSASFSSRAIRQRAYRGNQVQMLEAEIFGFHMIDRIGKLALA